MEFEKLSIAELEAVIAAVKAAEMDKNIKAEDVMGLVNAGTVSINVGVSGKKYAWLLFEDGAREACVDVETLEELDKDSIRREFC